MPWGGALAGALYRAAQHPRRVVPEREPAAGTLQYGGSTRVSVARDASLGSRVRPDGVSPAC